MPAEDLGVVGKGKQSGTDGFAKFLEIATGEVGTAHTTAKECVACEHPAFNRSIEADATPGMTRRTEYFQDTLTNLDLLAVLQIQLGEVDITHRLHSKPNRLALGLNHIWMRVWMRCNGNAIATLHGIVARHMIHMAMGVDRHQRLQLMTVNETEQTVFLGRRRTTRVDNDTFLYFFIPYHIGVFRKRIEHQRVYLQHVENLICWGKGKEISVSLQIKPLEK